MAGADNKGKDKLSPEEEAQEGNAAADPSKAGMAGRHIAWVHPLDDCPHLQNSTFVTNEQLPRVTSTCGKCGDASENWGCLSCGHVYCGRYVQADMLEHNGNSGHPIAVSFSDLSFWCFPCEQYLNGLTNQKLRPILDALHQQKFGEPLPEGRVELQLET